MNGLFAVVAGAMVVYGYLVFRTGRRWNSLLASAGHLADYGARPNTMRILGFVLSNRHVDFSDPMLTRLVISTRIALGVVVAALVIYALSTGVFADKTAFIR